MNLADITNPNLTPPGTLTKWGYRVCSDLDYHAFPAISNGLIKCPTLAEMYAYLTRPHQQTEALAMGTLADMAILTPNEPWTERFAAADIPINPKTGEAYGPATKKAASAIAEAQAANPGKFVASVDEIRSMTVELRQLTDAFQRSALCRQSLEGALLQVSGFLFHPRWQCWVKWKPDVLPTRAEKAGWGIADLKTTRRHPLQFERDCSEFDYWNQAGWYAHCHETALALQGLALRVSFFDFLVVSKPDDGRRPRPAMARKIRVPLDPELNLYMAGFQRRVFPADGMGRVEMFLAALGEHVAAAVPDVSRIWTAYDHESEPFVLAKLPRH